MKGSDTLAMAKEMVGLRLPQGLIDAVDVIAHEETRTRANAIERILTSWFREHRPELLVSESGEPKPYRDELSGRK